MLFTLKKIAGLLIRLFNTNVPANYKYFYRDTYVCIMLQCKYVVRDFILKKKYKVIDYKGEFGAELQFSLPFAYWHFKNGTLKETKSFPGTRELYFFSEHHQEDHEVRTNEGNYNFELPRILYSQNYNMKKWLSVPLKEIYKNDIYKFDKPILVIANRYNTEWDGAPVSFFDIDTLNELIVKLKAKYTIIYNRPMGKDIVNDNSLILDLNEFDWLRQTHPEVLLIQDLHEKNEIGAKNFNHFQLCIYANADHFISLHGGTGTLASYFGGKNILLSAEGPEHYFNCYKKLYPKFSGAEVYHAKNYAEVINYANLYL
ncbi:hypothetical protein [Pedobacter namyangjuensis]|uniref:hypothetical protein n=1 Tax=Pedobacter namyangjuensis TaxID=600626 RepID=UPI000DE2707B|nr:hypothetical protein [Pedobacter namyangjuensis]